MGVELRSAPDAYEAVICLFGVCDAQDAERFRNVVDDALDEGAKVVTLDLSGVTSFTEHCVAALLGARRRAADSGAELRLRAPSLPCRRKLEITGVATMFRPRSVAARRTRWYAR